MKEITIFRGIENEGKARKMKQNIMHCISVHSFLHVVENASESFDIILRARNGKDLSKTNIEKAKCWARGFEFAEILTKTHRIPN